MHSTLEEERERVVRLPPRLPPLYILIYLLFWPTIAGQARTMADGCDVDDERESGRDGGHPPTGSLNSPQIDNVFYQWKSIALCDDFGYKYCLTQRLLKHPVHRPFSANA